MDNKPVGGGGDKRFLDSIFSKMGIKGVGKKSKTEKIDSQSDSRFKGIVSDFFNRVSPKSSSKPLKAELGDKSAAREISQLGKDQILKKEEPQSALKTLESLSEKRNALMVKLSNLPPHMKTVYGNKLIGEVKNLNNEIAVLLKSETEKLEKTVSEPEKEPVKITPEIKPLPVPLTQKANQLMQETSVVLKQLEESPTEENHSTTMGRLMELRAEMKTESESLKGKGNTEKKLEELKESIDKINSLEIKELMKQNEAINASLAAQVAENPPSLDDLLAERDQINSELERRREMPGDSVTAIWENSTRIGQLDVKLKDILDKIDHLVDKEIQKVTEEIEIAELELKKTDDILLEIKDLKITGNSEKIETLKNELKVREEEIEKKLTSYADQPELKEELKTIQFFMVNENIETITNKKKAIEEQLNTNKTSELEKELETIKMELEDEIVEKARLEMIWE